MKTGDDEYIFTKPYNVFSTAERERKRQGREREKEREERFKV